MNILEDLYYGNVCPVERTFGGKEQWDQLLEYLSRHQQTLLEGFTEEQKKTFEKYQDCSLELWRLAEADAFTSGFRMGGQIVFAVMGEKGSQR